MRLLHPDARPLADDDLLPLYDATRPALRAGFVASVDGAVALDGGSRGLSTPSDRVALRTLRGLADALLVGAGTVRREDYGPLRFRPSVAAYRAATGRATTAPLVVVSRALDLDPGARCFEDGSTVVVTCAASPAGRRSRLADVSDVVVCGDDDVDLPAALDELRARGREGVLCEGGPQLLHGLLLAGLVDELALTVSPVLTGGPGLLPAPLPAPAELQLLSLVDGGDGALLTRWRVGRPH